VLVTIVWLSVKSRMAQATEHRTVVMVDPKRAS
jgi:hypothetical protein